MLRVLHVGSLDIKRYGLIPNSFERKMIFGLLRNDYCVYEFSDKDIARFEALLNISALGVRAANRRLLETVDNFHPDLIVFCNSRKISNATIREIQALKRNIKIACYTCDPLFSTDNRAHQVERLEVCDALFVTMAGQMLKDLAAEGKAPVYYLPNPTDPSVEYLNNFDRDALSIDLLFCGTGGDELPRTHLIRRLQADMRDMNIQVHGILGRPKILGFDYFQVLSQTRMALNINKQEQPLYSSDRLSQLMGNGVLAVLHADSGLQCFFDPDKAIFFSGYDDLIARLREVGADDAKRRAIARAGTEFYRKHFSSRLVARFLVERTLDLTLTEDYIWPVQSF